MKGRYIMKLCPNCHRISKDDDFCSRCGSAVYDDNTSYSVDCSQFSGHTHEKQSFSGKNSYELNRTGSPDRTSYGSSGKKKGGGFIKVILIFMLLSMFAAPLMELLDEIIWFLEDAFNF